MAKKVSGFITLHRQIVDWEWYKVPTVKDLFIHLLLSANFSDGRFQGEIIRRGQLATSLPSLATETGMTVQQIRTALTHLKATGEITDKANRRYRVITVLKYDDYQNDTDKSTVKTTGCQQTDNRQITDNQQTDNRQITGYQQQYNNNNKGTIKTKEQGNNNKESVERNAKRFLPPTRKEIEIFCLENGLRLDIDRFLNYYESNGWMVGRNKMKDWRATVRNWATKDDRPSTRPVPAPRRNSADNFDQRDYSGVDQELMSGLADEIRRMREEDGG